MVSSALLWISIFSAVKHSLATTFEGVVYFSQYVPVGTAGNELVTENVGTFLDITIDECKKRCHHMKACDFVNYHSVSHTCFIVRHVDKTVHVTGSHGNGFSLGIKAEWTFEADTKCESCTENEICSETEGNETCSVAICGLPDIPDYAVVTGNMRNVGSLATVSCNTSSPSEPETKVTTTCLKDGNWSSVNLTCMHEPECGTIVPLVTGPYGLPDSQISASSVWDEDFLAKDGRLDGPKAWAADHEYTNEYLQFNFVQLRNFTSIVTQGYEDPIEYTETYRVLASTDCSTYTHVQTFSGNTDGNSHKNNTFSAPFVARCIRVNPTEWFFWPTLRVEINGCSLLPLQ